MKNKSSEEKSHGVKKGNKYSGFESVMNSISSGHHDIYMESGIFSVMGCKKRKKKADD